MRCVCVCVRKCVSVQIKLHVRTRMPTNFAQYMMMLCTAEAHKRGDRENGKAYAGQRWGGLRQPTQRRSGRTHGVRI